MPHATVVPLLTVQARVEGGWLLVDYKSINRGTEAVLTYDGAPSDTGSEYPDLSSHRGVFALFREPATLQVKRILHNPDEQEVRSIFIPSVYRLGPGETRAAKFRLPVPVVEKNEFAPDFSGATWAERGARTLEVHVGFMVLPPGSTLRPYPANPSALKVVGTHGPQEIVVASAAVDVSVRVRTDASFRRL